jgi:hypothetical protein
VLPHKQAAYDAKYSTKIRGGESFFRQVDREESLIHLLRVNVLKRMESAVPRSPDRQAPARRRGGHARQDRGHGTTSIEELDIDDVDIDDPAFESLLVGRKVKVLLQDVDRVRWRQDLIEDRNRLATLLSAARKSDAARDAKLERAQGDHRAQVPRKPINPGNRKVIVFTAFADTASISTTNLVGRSPSWASFALVTGTGRNQTTLPNLRKDLSSILTAFSPRSKERPADSPRGRNRPADRHRLHQRRPEPAGLRHLINYDIHWNPVRIIQRFGRIDRIGSPNSASSSSTSGPTWSWRNTSTSSSASAAAWCCSTFPPPARRTSSSSSPATR